VRQLGAHAEHDARQVDAEHAVPVGLFLGADARLDTEGSSFSARGYWERIGTCNGGAGRASVTSSEASDVGCSIEARELGHCFLDPLVDLFGITDVELCESDLGAAELEACVTRIPSDISDGPGGYASRVASHTLASFPPDPLD
jgi:hypothetical protein